MLSNKQRAKNNQKKHQKKVKRNKIIKPKMLKESMGKKPEFNSFLKGMIGDTNIAKYSQYFKEKGGKVEPLTYENTLKGIDEVYPMVVSVTCTLQLLMIHGLSKYDIDKEYVDSLNKNIVQFIENTHVITLVCGEQGDMETLMDVFDSLVGNIFELQEFMNLLVSDKVAQHKDKLDEVFGDIVKRFEDHPDVNVVEMMFKRYVDSIWAEFETKSPTADETQPSATDEQGQKVDVEEVDEETAEELGFAK